ncbi:MAG: PHP domain-containing protein [Romboutsia timonensis]
MNKRYNNYHKHSHRSNTSSPDSIVKNEDYAKRAVELGHTTLFSTEHGYGGSIFEVVTLAEQYGLNPIFAIEGYIVADANTKDKGNYHIVIIPRNDKARRQLNVANSNANMYGYYYKPRLFLNELLTFDKNDFYITTACCGGLLKDEESVNNIFIPLVRHFGDGLFLEIQNHNEDSQKEINKKALKYKETLGLRLIHANDSHYIYENDAQDRLQMMKGKNINYGSEDSYTLDYPDYDTILKRYRIQGVLSDDEVKEALENTLIFDNIKNIDINKLIKMPNIYPLLTVKGRLKLLKQHICDKYKVLRVKENITKEESELYQKAIIEEFKIIEDTAQIHSMDYFLLNEKLVELALSKYGGYLTSTSRGSGGSFLINKVLGLTQLDRIRSEIPLYAERFMSAARLLGDNPPYTSSLPDFDFNILEQEPFRKASRELLGEDGCYPMIAYGTMKEGEAFRNTCRAKGLEFSSYNEVAKDLDSYRDDPYWGEVIKESQKYNGVIISSSVHPCSHLLLDSNIREELGVIKVGEEYCCPITSLEADEWHYLKNDYLLVESIGLTKHTYDMLNKPVDSLYELKDKLDDKVWDVYAKGLTCAINQFDSLWATNMSKDYQPRTIKEVAMFNAAIRPNFNDYRDRFMNRDKSFTNGNEFLDKLFEKTDKWILYQENLMQFFEALGIPPSESIGLIKKISKKKIKPEHFKALEERLKKGWLKAIGDMDDFDTTWENIQTYMNYGYNTPHSLAMAYDSLYNAYLKSHYPLEFYSVALENYKDDKERTARLIKELEYFNIKVVKPKFRYSKSNYFPDKESNSIYKGIGSIKYLSSKVADELYELRNNEYDTFLDLLIDIDNLTSLDNRGKDILIKLGFFEEFGGSKKLTFINQLYNDVYSKKVFNKSKLPCGISEDIFRSFAGKETKSQFREVDLRGLIKEVSSMVDNKDISIISRLKAEKEYLGYCDTVIDGLDSHFFVLEYDTKYTPKVVLYCMGTGETIEAKISKKIWDSTIVEGTILIIPGFTQKEGKTMDKETGKWKPNGKMVNWILTYDILRIVI